MARINTNVPALVAQRHLGRSQRELELSLERLSSGLRINRGADNPAGLIVSENLFALLRVLWPSEMSRMILRRPRSRLRRSSPAAKTASSMFLSSARLRSVIVGWLGVPGLPAPALMRGPEVIGPPA